MTKTTNDPAFWVYGWHYHNLIRVNYSTLQICRLKNLSMLDSQKKQEASEILQWEIVHHNINAQRFCNER